ncbi:MAG: MATE family efflux transporter [Eubacteriales bacterium]
MNTKNIGEELEQNSLQKTIGKYALPAILSGLVAALYNIIDQLFIGHIIGIDGNAATNIAFPLVTLTTAIMLLLGLGGAVNFSIALGKKDLERGKKFVGAVLVVTPLVGLLITTITLLFLNPLLWTLGATENSFDLAFSYVSITAFGFPLWMSAEATTKVIRSDGSPKYAMICSLTGAFLNCILNPLLMIGFDMGIEGAAWATVIGQGVSFFLAIRYFKNFKSFPLKWEEIKPDSTIIKQICKIGAAPFLQQLVMMLTQIVMNNMVVHYGGLSAYGTEIPLACVGIITKVNALYMAIMIGIAQGAQPLLGYSYGAKKPDKVLEIYLQCIKYACAISVLVFLSFQIFPRQILSAFGGEGELFFEFGVNYFRIFMALTFLNGIQPVTFNFFTAIGKPLKSAIVSLSKQLLFLIPLLLILPTFLGIDGLLYAGPVADSLAFAITMVFLRKEISELQGNPPEETVIA